MRRRGGDDEFKHFGTSSTGSAFGTGSSDEFQSPLFTPRRAQAADEVLRSSSFAAGSQLGFDHALTHGRNNPFQNEVTPGFGVESLSSAPTRNSSLVAPAGGAGKKFGTSSTNSTGGGPSSLLDAGRTRTGVFNNEPATFASLPRSPSHAPARALRSGTSSKDFAAPPVPVQSLRDSPFMRQPAASAAGQRNTPGLGSRQTPFDSDASPIRPIANSTFTPAGSKQQQEEKSSEETPAGNRLFKETPFGSPDDGAWPAGGVLATPSSHVAQTGLGFGARNPCAVTVFGFSAAQAARVLARFYALGEVIAREDAQSDGSMQPNWTHLLYRTPVAASMALALNGRVVEGCMVGVKPRDPGPAQKTSFNTPAADRTGSIFERSGRKAAQTSAAQLTASSIYANSQSTNPTLVHKSFCTRLMEYLFNY